jgi:PAS domain S-box-containing protein
MQRQQVLADFGEFALRSQDLNKILNEACRLVGEALGTGRAKILEIQHEGRSLLVRAGAGWDPGIVGNLRIPMEENSSETFAIAAGEPVITQDISKEERFGVPPFMGEAGVVALVNVPIFLPGGQPYGLLQVDDTRLRDFGADEVQFLRTYATILGPVIDRLLMARSLRLSEERFRLTVGAALDYAVFLSDPQDRITDWLPGAEAVFGWTAEEAMGQPAAITFTPEDRAARQDQWETGTASKEGVAPNVRWHLHKDGQRVFIEGSTRALRDADGALQGFLKIGQDVTERRAVEERLHESEERFRQFGEASSDLIWIRSADTLQFEPGL